MGLAFNDISKRNLKKYDKNPDIKIYPEVIVYSKELKILVQVTLDTHGWKYWESWN